MWKIPPVSEIPLHHHHFILDAYLVQLLDSSKKESITRALVNDLLQKLDMKELCPLQIYPATDIRAPGWSFVQPITTSHISGHYFESPGIHPHIHLDIYSCQGFDWKMAFPVLAQHMPLGIWQATFIYRNIDSDENKVDDRSILDIQGSGMKIIQTHPVK